MSRVLVVIGLILSGLRINPCDLCPPPGEPAPRYCEFCSRR